MNSSGKMTRSAPCPAASARARRTLSALPAISPTVQLSCATAIARVSAGRAFTPLEAGNGRHRHGAPRALFLEQFGEQECEVDRLLGIEPRVANRVIAIVEIGLGDGAGAAGAIGHVLPGHFPVLAAGVRTLGLM